MQQKFTQSRLDNILDNMHPDIFKTKLGKDAVATINRLMHFYERADDKTLLEEVKNKILNGSEIKVTDDWLRSNDFIEYLTDEEKTAIGNKLTFPSNIDELKEFLSSSSLFKEKNYFVDIICRNTMTFIRSNEDLKFTIFSSANKLFDENELKEIFFSLNRTEQLRQIDNIKFGIKFVYQRLKENPTFYNDVILRKNDVTFFSLDVDANKEYIEYIFNCLDENQRNIFYVKSVLDELPNLRERYREYVFSNPPNLSRIIEEYFTEEELKKIYQECSVEVYAFPSYGSMIEKDTSYFDKRIQDLIAAVNNGDITISFWIRHLSEDSMKLFMQGLTGSKKISLLTNVKDKNLRKKLISLIVESGLAGDLLDTYEGTFRVMFMNLSKDEINYLLENLNNYNLILFLNKININSLESEFIRRITERSLLLGESSTIKILPRVLMTISDKNREFIHSLIEKDFQAVNKFIELKNRIETNDYIAKASFTYAVSHNLIREDNIALVMDMLNKDPFLFSSLDTRLLREDTMQMGEHFTRKTSRYPSVAYKLMKILDKDSNLSSLVISMSKHLSQVESSYDVYDSKMEIIINYLSSLSFNDYENLEITEDVLVNFEDYIIQQYRIQQSTKKDGYQILDAKFDCDIRNYHSERNNYLDEMLEDITDINQLRNLFYNRYFWLDYSSVQEFMYTYATNYHDVLEYAVSDTPIKYINLIQKIESIEDFNTLRELYQSMTEEYSISDYMTITGIMKNAYNKANANIVNKGVKGNIVTQEFVIDGKKVTQDMIELTPPYGLFVHSTDAYGAMEMINDNYFESWNYNTRTENHGICTCYITNTSYGTANVKGKGVMFGFNKINEHSIATMGPYDLVTRNEGYTITSVRTPLYMRMDKVSSFTRHTHNEFDLERRNDTIEDRFPCIQPDCVIIFEDMDDNIKANALKAVADFKEKGVELQVIYIDRIKNLKREGDLISKGIEEYKTSHNLDLLRHIIDRYESNLCGSDFFEDIDVNEVLKTSEIEQVLSETVEHIGNIADVNLRNIQLNRLIEILESEQHKFDLIEENIGNRAHKFKLYNDELKEKIKALLNTSQLVVENTNSKVA